MDIHQNGDFGDRLTLCQALSFCAGSLPDARQDLACGKTMKSISELGSLSLLTDTRKITVLEEIYDGR